MRAISGWDTGLGVVSVEALTPVDWSQLPATLLHGTKRDNLKSILAEGLRPSASLQTVEGSRMHVHLGTSVQALRSGSSLAVVFDTERLSRFSEETGTLFFQTASGYVVTEGVLPTKLFDCIQTIDWMTNKLEVKVWPAVTSTETRKVVLKSLPREEPAQSGAGSSQSSTLPPWRSPAAPKRRPQKKQLRATSAVEEPE